MHKIKELFCPKYDSALSNERILRGLSLSKDVFAKYVQAAGVSGMRARPN